MNNICNGDVFVEPIEYDFIVVGSGASGAALATRLSEVPEWKVLLIEAGAPETEFTKIPALKSYLQSTPYNWHYTTTPQLKYCQGTLTSNSKIVGFQENILIL